jgi:hypothetical protein
MGYLLLILLVSKDRSFLVLSQEFYEMRTAVRVILIWLVLGKIDAILRGCLKRGVKGIQLG